MADVQEERVIEEAHVEEAPLNWAPWPTDSWTAQEVEQLASFISHRANMSRQVCALLIEGKHETVKKLVHDALEAMIANYTTEIKQYCDIKKK